MRQGPHPLRFFVLILPYAAAFGYTTVALQWVATNRFGVSVDDFNKAIASAFVVHGIKVLWAPVVDTTLGKRAWYLISLLTATAGVMAQSLLPISTERLGLLIAVVMAAQIPLTLIGMACETLLGNLPELEKGRAAGFYQAGNFVGSGLGGGLALHLTTALPRPWMAGAVLSLLMLPCALALIGMDEPPRHPSGLFSAVGGLGRDLAGIVARKIDGRWVASIAGITGLLICLSPIGSGGAANLFPSIARDWGAAQGSVEAVNGWLGGLAGGVGAALGGWTADRMNRKYAYALSGALIALSGLALGLLPRTPACYDAGVLLYSVFTGMAYATFSAFVLETIGGGAVATKYNIFASLSNLAVAYSGRIDSAAYTRWHARGLFYTDSTMTLAGIGALFLLIVAMRRFQARSSDSGLSSRT